MLSALPQTLDLQFRRQQAFQPRMILSRDSALLIKPWESVLFHLREVCATVINGSWPQIVASQLYCTFMAQFSLVLLTSDLKLCNPIHCGIWFHFWHDQSNQIYPFKNHFAVLVLFTLALHNTIPSCDLNKTQGKANGMINWCDLLYPQAWHRLHWHRISRAGYVCYTSSSLLTPLPLPLSRALRRAPTSLPQQTAVAHWRQQWGSCLIWNHLQVWWAVVLQVPQTRLEKLYYICLTAMTPSLIVAQPSHLHFLPLRVIAWTAWMLGRLQSRLSVHRRLWVARTWEKPLGVSSVLVTAIWSVFYLVPVMTVSPH